MIVVEMPESYEAGSMKALYEADIAGATAEIYMAAPAIRACTSCRGGRIFAPVALQTTYALMLYHSLLRFQAEGRA
jgi:hypothetical protein